MRKAYFTLKFLYLLMLFLALANPYRFYGIHLPSISSFSIVEPVLCLGATYLVLRILSSGRIFIGPSLLFKILSLPIILSVTSLFWTQDVNYTINEILVNSEALMVYIVVLNFAKYLDRESLLKIFLLFACSLLAVALASYPPFNFIAVKLPIGLANEAQKEYMLSYYARFSHPFIGLSNNFATILALIFPITFYIGKYTRSKLWIFTSALVLGATVATLSRGVLLGILVTFLSISLIKIVTKMKISRKIPIYCVYLLSGIGLMAVVAYYVAPEMATHLTDRLDLNGANVRFAAYKEAVHVISLQPLLGYGGGVPFAAYSSAHLTSIHNTFLQQLFWYGLPLGMVSGLAYLSLPFALSRISPVDDLARQIQKGLTVAIACQLFIMVTEASWEGSMLRTIIYAIIGLSIAMMLAEPEKSKTNLNVCLKPLLT